VVEAAAPLATKTAWARHLAAPVRDYLRTETGGALFLFAATLVALAWANLDQASYESVWTTELSLRLGGAGVVPGAYLLTRACEGGPGRLHGQRLRLPREPLVAGQLVHGRKVAQLHFG
jgi:hypothetical protein